MTTRQVRLERLARGIYNTLKEVVAGAEKAIGHPDMSAFGKSIRAAKTYSELETIVRGATGPSELMEFTRMDLGEVLRKRNAAATPLSLRFIVGNPVIMSQMVQHVAEARPYAPVTRLIY